jgi:hypothetical protein
MFGVPRILVKLQKKSARRGTNSRSSGKGIDHRAETLKFGE